MNIKNTITFLFAAAVLVLAGSVETNAQSAKMKSLMNDIKTEFPGREKQVAEGCDGAKIVYDVDFASFGDDYDALLRVPSVGLNQSTFGIRRFCTDSNNTSQTDKAKVEALRSKVKTVRLKNITDKSAKKVTLLKDGTLLIEEFFHDYDGGFSDMEIQSMLGDIL